MRKIISLVLGAFLVLMTTACSGNDGMKLIQSDSDYVKTDRGTPEEVYSLSFDIIGGDDVMPIGGFYGPFTASSSVNGQRLPDYVSEEYFQMIQDIGINLIVNAPEYFSANTASVVKALELCETYNIGYFVADTFINDVIRAGKEYNFEQLAQLVDQINCSEGFVGILSVDEPTTKEFDEMQKIYQGFYDLGLEGKHVYSNLFPTYGTGLDYSGEGRVMTYEEYVTSFIDTVQPKFLSYDHYPYETQNFAQYFVNLSTIRKITQEKKIPFWSFIQSGGQFNDSLVNRPESEPYRPNESQMLWDINMNLAYGAKGIQYFPLLQPEHFSYAPNETYDYLRNGLIGAMGNKNQWYFYAQKANKQIRAIDSVLMNAKNMGIIVSGEEAKQLVGAHEEVFSNGKFRELQKVSGEALVGCFDYQGGTALYVVNFSKTEKGKVSMSFSDHYGYDVVQRGQSVGVCGKELTLTLEAGEGALVVLR